MVSGFVDQRLERLGCLYNRDRILSSDEMTSYGLDCINSQAVLGVGLETEATGSIPSMSQCKIRHKFSPLEGT